MANDFYSQAAITRANMIEAEMAAAKADLMAHKANNDVESASASVQTIANLEAERANLTTLYQNYVQSQQPPAPEQLSDEERHARPWNKMTYNDVLELTKTSKYFKDGWNADMQAGYVEAQRRRQRGE
jgi:aspartyl/asparaginyl-tRNA synthetase